MNLAIGMNIDDAGAEIGTIGEIATGMISLGVIAGMGSTATMPKNAVTEACEKVPIVMMDARRKTHTEMTAVIGIAHDLVTVDMVRYPLGLAVSEIMI